ncbi:MAG: hypothetical protein QS721_03750 [Candidatus Endonucleobacter sp. (ex Gigantidas childressi)]|nr:hypothetical protein [Candidatus Endonucleobacter sp. (ex Gigantidas childressi)]
MSKCLERLKTDQMDKTAMAVEMINPYVMGSLKELLSDPSRPIEDEFKQSLPSELNHYFNSNIDDSRRPIFVIDGLQLARNLQSRNNELAGKSADECADGCTEECTDGCTEECAVKSLSSNSTPINPEQPHRNNTEWSMTSKLSIAASPEKAIWEGVKNELSFSSEPLWRLSAELYENSDTDNAMEILHGLQHAGGTIASRVNGLECTNGKVRLPGQDLDISVVKITPDVFLRTRNDGIYGADLLGCRPDKLTVEMCQKLLAFLPESQNKLSIIKRASEVDGGLEMLGSEIQKTISRDLVEIDTSPWMWALEPISPKDGSKITTTQDEPLSGNDGTVSAEGSENAGNPSLEAEVTTGSDKVVDSNVAAEVTTGSDKVVDSNVAAEVTTGSDKVVDSNVAAEVTTGSDKVVDSSVAAEITTGSDKVVDSSVAAEVTTGLDKVVDSNVAAEVTTGLEGSEKVADSNVAAEVTTGLEKVVDSDVATEVTTGSEGSEKKDDSNLAAEITTSSEGSENAAGDANLVTTAV